MGLKGVYMSNIIDYIKWRGDISIKQDKFNEIDSLILSRFSYFPFDTLIKENEVLTIKELSERFKKEDVNNLNILWPDDVYLFPTMGESKRFGEMKATKFVNKISQEQEKQFSAITVILPDNTIYIAFRGTDNTLVGWKEDFNMSFKSHLAAQKDAVKYLEDIAKIYTKSKIRIGGHSKGGNLAMYASVFASDKVKNRIISVYNNDGPGFGDDITQTAEYRQGVGKIHTYIPQDSVFGRLLNHEEKYTVVNSKQKGLMEHDVYSWQLEGKNFTVLKEVTDGSIFVDKAITDWLEKIDVEQREKVIDIIFDVINKTQAKTFAEIKLSWLENSKIIIESYREIDKENRKMITATLAELLRIVKDNFIEEHVKKDYKEEAV